MDSPTIPDTAGSPPNDDLDNVVSLSKNQFTTIRSKLKNRDYWWNRHPACKTCSLDNEVVRQIHLQVLDGIAVAQIHRSLPEEGRPNYRSILHHCQSHFSLGYKTGLLDATLANVLGKEADDIFNHPETVHSSEGVARLLLSKGASVFQQGHMEIKTSDLINVTKLVREIEQDEKSVDEARYFAEAMGIILTEAKKALPSEDFDAMIWRLQSNPDMQRILRKVRGEPEEEYVPPPPQSALEPPVIEAQASEPSPMSVIV